MEVGEIDFYTLMENTELQPKIETRGRKSKYTEEFKEVLFKTFRKNRGKKLKTCYELHLDPTTWTDWETKYPAFQQAIETIKEEERNKITERVEDNLMNSALDEKKPNTVAQIFYLKNNDPRYSEKVDHNVNVPVLWFQKREKEGTIEGEVTENPN